jgi:hypothetical protein
MRRIALLVAVVAWVVLAGGCRQILGIEGAELLPRDGGGDAPAPDAPAPDALTPDALNPDAGADAPDPDGGVDGALQEDANPDDAGDAGATCPSDMWLVGSAVCVDRFEASAGDGGVALSVYGGWPWVNIGLAAASSACGLAGKRLCRMDEWRAACQGPGLTDTFPYGSTYEELKCNGVASGAGWVIPTGNMPNCWGHGFDIYDLSGNVWEWTDDPDYGTWAVVGGSYLDDTAESLSCTSARSDPPGTTDPTIGFRCCRDP